MRKVLLLLLWGWLLWGCTPDMSLPSVFFPSLTPEAVEPKSTPTAPLPAPTPLTPEEVVALLPEVGLFGQDTAWQLAPPGGYTAWAAWDEEGTMTVVTEMAQYDFAVESWCEVHWYDSDLLACAGQFIYFSSDTAYTELPVFVLEAAAIDLEQVLAAARVIYRYQGHDLLAVLLGQGDQGPDKLTIIRGVAQIEELLAAYPHTVVPVIPPADQFENVEIVVPRKELGYHGKWNLSPAGDKLVYQTGTYQTTILLPATGQRYTIGGCELPIWLDNTILECDTIRINTADLIDVPTELDQIREADQEWQSSFGDPEEKSSSPNGRYYSLLDLAGLSLTIYDAETEQQLSQFHIKGYPSNYGFVVRGWAADSSGVYFQTTQTGLFMVPRPQFSHHSDIRKLVAP